MRSTGQTRARARTAYSGRDDAGRQRRDLRHRYPHPSGDRMDWGPRQAPPLVRSAVYSELLRPLYAHPQHPGVSAQLPHASPHQRTANPPLGKAHGFRPRATDPACFRPQSRPHAGAEHVLRRRPFRRDVGCSGLVFQGTPRPLSQRPKRARGNDGCRAHRFCFLSSDAASIAADLVRIRRHPQGVRWAMVV